MFLQFGRGGCGVAGGADSTNADHIGPVGVFQFVDEADLFLSAKLAALVFVKFKAFVLLEVDTLNPRPVGLRASRGIFQEEVHDHDNDPISLPSCQSAVCKKTRLT